ncbi:MAG: VOC family protein [Proteobacteria bacterium]|nr:VOC family protein [Pseudomonadota bacterium]
MSQVFGEIKQVAYVTRDFDRAVDFFLKSGIGPWYVHKKRWMRNLDYRGTRVDVEMSVGVANSGSLQFEIIEPTNDVHSVYSEWLQQHPHELLVQHLSSWPEDFVGAEKRVRAAGYKAVMAGMLDAGAFGYYQHPDRPGFTMEMAELSPARRAIWAAVARGAVDWDGSDPIRPWPIPPAK